LTFGPPLLAASSVFLFAMQGWSDGLKPTLSNGVVTYEENGRRKEIQVGRKCTDLWVSPDESVVAFIAIHKSKPATPQEIEPFIQESSIYIARKSDHFKPVHLVVKVELDGRSWKVVREPKLAPDHETVYFFVPNTMTTSKLMSTKLPARSYEALADATEYCVVWGGDHPGELILLARHDPEPTDDDPAPGVSYPCYVRSQSGSRVKLAEECFAEFDQLSSRWSHEHGGTCH
jgi:hypothetical protein